VYFQVLGYTAMEMLEKMFKASGIEKYAELFIPHRGVVRDTAKWEMNLNINYENRPRDSGIS